VRLWLWKRTLQEKLPFEAGDSINDSLEGFPSVKHEQVRTPEFAKAVVFWHDTDMSTLLEIEEAAGKLPL
jgi:hypothetical protein